MSEVDWREIGALAQALLVKKDKKKKVFSIQKSLEKSGNPGKGLMNCEKQIFLIVEFFLMVWDFSLNLLVYTF